MSILKWLPKIERRFFLLPEVTISKELDEQKNIKSMYIVNMCPRKLNKLDNDFPRVGTLNSAEASRKAFAEVLASN